MKETYTYGEAETALIVWEAILDWANLHGNEHNSYTRRLGTHGHARARSDALGLAVKIETAYRALDEAEREALSAWSFGWEFVPDLMHAIEEWSGGDWPNVSQVDVTHLAKQLAPSDEELQDAWDDADRFAINEDIADATTSLLAAAKEGE